MLVGRRSIFLVRPDGGGAGGPQVTSRSAAAHGSEAPSAVRAQRRLGYTPLCSCIVGQDGTSTTAAPDSRAGPGERLVVCAPGADTGYGGQSGTASQLHVLGEEGPDLLWSARLQATPVAVRSGRFDGVPGLLVTLDTQGRVLVTYMGTEPPRQSASGMVGAEGKQVDYGAIDKEYRELLGQIEQQQAVAEGKGPGSSDVVVLRLAVQPQVQTLPPGSAEARAAAAHGERVGAPVLPPATTTVRALVQFTGGADTAAEDIRISLRLPPGAVAVAGGGPGGSEEAGTVVVPRL